MDVESGPSAPKQKTAEQLAKQRERRRRQRYNRREREKKEQAAQSVRHSESKDEDWEDIDSEYDYDQSWEPPYGQLGLSSSKTHFGQWTPFSPREYSQQQSLIVARLENLTSGIEKVGIRQIIFTPGLNVTDNYLDAIAGASPEFRKGLEFISCGDSSRSTSNMIEITDKSVLRLVKACHNLEYIMLFNCTKLTEPLPHMIKHCPKIISITVTAKEGSDTALGLRGHGKGGPVEYLVDKYESGYRKNLRYMEIHGLSFDISRKDFFNVLTLNRPDLDVVVGSIDPPIVARFSDGHEDILEGHDYVSRSRSDEKRMLRRLAKMFRDPELERYGAYDDADEEYGDMFGSDSDDDYYDDDDLTYEECAMRGYYDEDYNPYDRNGDVDVDFLAAHGYYG